MWSVSNDVPLNSLYFRRIKKKIQQHVKKGSIQWKYFDVMIFPQLSRKYLFSWKFSRECVKLRSNVHFSLKKFSIFFAKISQLFGNILTLFAKRNFAIFRQSYSGCRPRFEPGFLYFSSISKKSYGNIDLIWNKLDQKCSFWQWVELFPWQSNFDRAVRNSC